MNYSFKLRHGFMLGISSLLALGVASNISADESPRPTLIECHDLLPRGVQYDFRIVSEIDTREGQTGEMGITLLDRAKPDDRGIPAGADQFVECVKQVVGVEDNGQKSDA